MAALGGAARTFQLSRAGVRHEALRSAVDSGDLIKITRGCYALPGADPAVVAEVAWRGRACCTTLAKQLGLPALGADDRIHLHVPAGRSTGGRHQKPPRQVQVHWDSDLTGLDPYLLAIASARRCLGRVAQLAMVDAALERGVIALEDVENCPAIPLKRRLWLADNADATCQSPAETVARMALTRARLPHESQQHIVNVGRVDFLVGRRLIVEVDGRDYHSSPAAFARDRRRDRAAQLAGFTTLRFTAAEVLSDPRWFAAAVQRALRAPRRR